MKFKVTKKTCITCKVSKKLEDFHKESSCKDGRRSECIQCRNMYLTLHKRKTYTKEYQHLKYLHKKKTGKIAEETAKSQERYPEKWTARQQLRNAVKSGIVKRLPCDVCGDEKSHGHHDDYSKPLEVRWLCATHHGEVHRKVIRYLRARE